MNPKDDGGIRFGMEEMEFYEEVKMEYAKEKSSDKSTLKAAIRASKKSKNSDAAHQGKQTFVLAN
ncbi:hypothetical protein RchiOBHm_Chr5g0045981 [Rosa chinensis]|uniref:Uncharacterized protein n=1 Tax=Rosa chinensis TaxID=74649 RepID=A0A2P6QDZ4_ROSCH|nr:hypothetical protein RchiOBHm_Chr5g0045981 [Rosa chinensis]